MIFEILNPMQTLSYVLIFISIVFGVLCLRRFPKYSTPIVAILSYALHSFVFYSVLVYFQCSGQYFHNIDLVNGWSSGLRLHFVLMMAAGFLSLYFGGKKWKL